MEPTVTVFDYEPKPGPHRRRRTAKRVILLTTLVLMAALLLFALFVALMFLSYNPVAPTD